VDFEWHDIVKAFESHIRDADSGHFMPKPADVIRVIRGNGESICLQAWSKIERAIKHVGPYQSVAFDDAGIHAVLEQMGGWVQLCRTSERNLSFVAKEFQNRYKAYRYHPPIEYPRYFVGLSEHQNSQQDFPKQATILIGDSEKAYAVMSRGTNPNNLSFITRITKGLSLGGQHA
jgi:hypothetical protein